MQYSAQLNHDQLQFYSILLKAQFFTDQYPAHHAESYDSTSRISPRYQLHSPSLYYLFITSHLLHPPPMPVTRQQLSVLPSPKPLVRATGIEGWAQEVASSSRGRSHQRLVEISSNIQTQDPHSHRLKTRQANTVQKRGRKRKDMMDDHAENIPGNKHEAAVDPRILKKGRGRPRKNPIQEIPILRPAPQFDAQTTSSRSPSKLPSRKSPSRKGARFFDKPRSTNIVDMKVLETCSPSVKQRSIADAKRSCDIPPEVMKLYTRLESVPDGGIPRRLQASLALLSFSIAMLMNSRLHISNQQILRARHRRLLNRSTTYPLAKTAHFPKTSSPR